MRQRSDSGSGHGQAVWCLWWARRLHVGDPALHQMPDYLADDCYCHQSCFVEPGKQVCSVLFSPGREEGRVSQNLTAESPFMPLYPIRPFPSLVWSPQRHPEHPNLLAKLTLPWSWPWPGREASGGARASPGGDGLHCPLRLSPGIWMAAHLQNCLAGQRSTKPKKELHQGLEKLGMFHSCSSSREPKRLRGGEWTLGMVKQEGRGGCPVSSMAHQRQCEIDE